MLEQSLNVEGRHSEQAQQPVRQTLSKFKENGSVFIRLKRMSLPILWVKGQPEPVTSPAALRTT